MVHTPAAFFLATTCRIEMTHAFQKTAYAAPFVGDTILACSNASFVNRQEKEVPVCDPKLRFDMLCQNSA